MVFIHKMALLYKGRLGKPCSSHSFNFFSWKILEMDYTNSFCHHSLNLMQHTDDYTSRKKDQRLKIVRKTFKTVIKSRKNEDAVS